MSVTIVSCFYKLHTSKHTLNEYDAWIKCFLLNINTNIIIFVGKNEKEYIKSIIDMNSTIKYVLIEKEMNDFNLVKTYNSNFWKIQEFIDPGKSCGRGQDCYKIWNSKFDFLKEAIEMNPFNSDKFIWNDIGNVRDKTILNYLKDYPNYNNITTNKLDIVLLEPFINPSQLWFTDEVHFSGSMFGGGKEILLELHKLFYLYFEMYARGNKFIGCDQQILSTLFLKNKDKFNCIIPKYNHIDKWFYLYEYYTTN